MSTVPPFAAPGEWAVAIDGTVVIARVRDWIPRPSVADDGPLTYDVVDLDDGRLIERVAMPPSTRVVGVGRNAVYVAFSDAFDLLHLRRYPLESRR